MKNTHGKSEIKLSGYQAKHTRPENKDDLDSRQSEEFDFKGDDMTHNKKDTKKDKLKKNEDK